jgi:hypothetical protein
MMHAISETQLKRETVDFKTSKDFTRLQGTSRDFPDFTDEISLFLP